MTWKNFTSQHRRKPPLKKRICELKTQFTAYFRMHALIYVKLHGKGMIAKLHVQEFPVLPFYGGFLRRLAGNGNSFSMQIRHRSTAALNSGSLVASTTLSTAKHHL